MPSERSAPSGGWREVYATMGVDADGADEADEVSDSGESDDRGETPLDPAVRRRRSTAD